MPRSIWGDIWPFATVATDPPPIHSSAWLEPLIISDRDSH